LYSAFTTRLWMRSIPCYTLPLEARAEERQIRTNLLVACVASERDTHARTHTLNTAAKDTAGVAGRLPLYPLEMTQLWKIFITGKPVHIEEAGLLGCFSVWLGNCFTTFRRITPPVSLGLWVRELTHNGKDESSTLIRNWSSNTEMVGRNSFTPLSIDDCHGADFNETYAYSKTFCKELRIEFR
jgi:hypothetical protein